MTRWNQPTNKKEIFNADISNGLPTTRASLSARSGASVQDRAGDRGVEYTEAEEESWIESWCWSKHASPVSLEVAFFAVMLGFGFSAVAATLLGLAEVMP